MGRTKRRRLSLLAGISRKTARDVNVGETTPPEKPSKW
jgi:hypothetical protein